MGRPQVLKVGNNTSATLTINTVAPQGCVLSPLLHDCVDAHNSNTIIRLPDDTTVVGLITNDDEAPYREEVRYLAVSCHDNNLSLTISKAKDVIVDNRKQKGEQALIHCRFRDSSSSVSTSRRN